jgi:glycolate oxidase FAD binding subunit
MSDVFAPDGAGHDAQLDDPAMRELIDRVRAARADGTRLDIRGGATKAWHGGLPEGEPLDVRPLAGITSHEPSELVVTVRAGTPLAELEAALDAHGQCLPFEPPRFGAAGPGGGAPQGDADGVGGLGGTVGGMVAAGLAGPARAAVGSVRDFVLGATMLDGRGQVLSFGGQVMKNVAGYDVSRLLAGSMGILGVICEVSLKVLPKPVATATLRFEADQAQAIRHLNTWGGQPLPLNASAWWQDTLVLRLSGAAAAVNAAITQLGGDLTDPDVAAAFWQGLRDQTDEFFASATRALGEGRTLWRLSVPAVAPPLGLPGDSLLEWGGAQRWLSTDAPAAVVREAARAAGGHATRWLAPRDDRGDVFAPLSAPLERIHRALKASFDPDGVFNRGRLLPGL